MQDRPKIVLFILVSIIVLLMGIREYVVIKLSTQGYILYPQEQELNRLSEENIILRSQLLEDESLVNIASRASQMGFIEQGPVLYIK